MKKISSRIYHGEDTEHRERKYQLFLVASTDDGSETKDGGAILIKDNFALTAAQLVTDSTGTPMTDIQLFAGGGSIRRIRSAENLSFRVVKAYPDTCKDSCMHDCNYGILKIHKDFSHRTVANQGDGYGKIHLIFH